MSTRIRGYSVVDEDYLVMCRACGYKRPKELGNYTIWSAAIVVAEQHNKSTIKTDVMGKAI